MNLLNSILYDPSTAATKVTDTLSVMTALDTTNLRLIVQVPLHGSIKVRLSCPIEGNVTYPQVLLGLMNGNVTVGRVSPTASIGGTALASTRDTLEANFVIPGLTPGNMTLDAAYSVDVAVPGTSIKYGGPNDTSGDNAWGAFQYEIWDPRPLPLQAPGNLNGIIIGSPVANQVTVGTVLGNVNGDVQGNVLGNLAGNVNGSILGNVSGNLSGNVSTVQTVTGNVMGSVSDVLNKSPRVIQPGVRNKVITRV